jgi:hypothetical protein
VRILKVHRVGHQQEVDGNDPIHLNLEDAVDPSQQRFVTSAPLIEVLEIMFDLHHESVKLVFKHGLNYELAIV